MRSYTSSHEGDDEDSSIPGIRRLWASDRLAVECARWWRTWWRRVITAAAAAVGAVASIVGVRRRVRLILAELFAALEASSSTAAAQARDQPPEESEDDETDDDRHRNRDVQVVAVPSLRTLQPGARLAGAATAASAGPAGGSVSEALVEDDAASR